MPKKITVALIVIIVLAGLIAAACGGFYLFALSRTPKLEGTFQCPGLADKVTVTRDNWGIPHIEAKNRADAYFALGYVTAQDRLFQIELQRRLARGELAEILGSELVNVDKMFRTYCFKHQAEHYLSRPEKIDPAALACLDSFLAGINHYIGTQEPPVEYVLLGAQPRPFTRLDVVSMLQYMAFTFATALETDTLYTMLAEKLPEGGADELFPGYRNEEPVTIMDTPVNFMKKAGDAALAGGASPAGAFLSPAARIFGVNFRAPKSPAEIWGLARLIAPRFSGSNSWAIGPSRSVSGKAILANDPHIEQAHPGVWYEVHLQYPGHDMYGFHLPICPFPMMGHGPDIAVGITMFENDDMDLYEETFNPQNPDEVKYRGAWAKVEILKETIKVQGSPDIALEVRITPHGPVVTDFLKGYEGKAVSMWWVGYQTDNPMLDSAYRMTTAKTMQDFRAAVSMIACPGLNIQYADSKGNIAWWAAAKIPIRPAHVNAKKILEGATGRDEVQGYLPFAMNPHLENPPCGIIVTANNLSTARPVGPIAKLAGYFIAVDRAARIIQLLSSKEKWSLEDLQKVQTDVYAYPAQRLIATVKQAVDGNPATIKEFTETERRAWETLIAWDRMSTIDSAGASIYHALTYHILKEGIGDELREDGEDTFKLYLKSFDCWLFLKHFVGDGQSAFWDDIRTKQRESRDVILARAFRATVKDLADRCGGDVSDWQWGRLHQIEYVHPVGMTSPMNIFYNLGPFPAPGDENIVNNMGHDFANHLFNNIIVIPSNRRLIDFGRLDKSYCILPAGNSGHFTSPHYGDQVPLYLAGQYRVINFTKAQIDKHAEHSMTLVPKR